ncbi:MAG: DUF5317 family protein [Candidatus Yanofskybacteria bacterium]|nr:DUF5317 family protein [Candidatus Yanofskybacteria bacterium]
MPIFVLTILTLVNEPGPLLVFLTTVIAGYLWRYQISTKLSLIIPLFILSFGIRKVDYGFLLLALGMLLNDIVILVNDDKMPVDKLLFERLISDAPNECQISELPANYILTDEHTKLRFLSDYLYFRGADMVFSPGDVLICLSYILIILIHW